MAPLSVLQGGDDEKDECNEVRHSRGRRISSRSNGQRRQQRSMGAERQHAESSRQARTAAIPE